MTCVIIDDEPDARVIIKNYLTDFFPEMELLGMAGNVEEATKLIIETSPDITFLDINLKQGNAFTILNDLPEVKTKIIFTTAYDEYAVTAFRYHAVDYLLKPIDPEEFCEAVKKAMEASPDETSGQLVPFDPSKVMVKGRDTVFFLEMNNIIRCEADVNYTTLFLTDGSRIVSPITLKRYDEQLNQKGFFRVHQSHLINTKHIHKLALRPTTHIVMSDGSEVPVSRRKKGILMDMIA